MTPDQVGCPRCGASVRAGADWCTLCYADLRPAVQYAPAEVTPTPADVSLAPAEVSLAPAGAPAAAAAPRGKHARGDSSYDEAPAAAPRTTPADDALEAEAMLAILAAESTRPIGGVAARLDSSGAKAAVMIGGIVAFTGLLFLLMVVVGSML